MTNRSRSLPNTNPAQNVLFIRDTSFRNSAIAKSLNEMTAAGFKPSTTIAKLTKRVSVRKRTK